METVEAIASPQVLSTDEITFSGCQLPRVTPHSRNKPKTTPVGQGLKRLRSVVCKEEIEHISEAGAGGKQAAGGAALLVGGPIAAVLNEIMEGQFRDQEKALAEFKVGLKRVNDVLVGHFREQEKVLAELRGELKAEKHKSNQYSMALYDQISMLEDRVEIEKLQSALRKEEMNSYCLTRENNCKICYNAPKEVVLFPCMHYEFCKNCVKIEKRMATANLQLLRCPLDRTVVKFKMTYEMIEQEG